MNQKEIKELIEFLVEKDIAEFELERGDVRVKIRRGSQVAPTDIRYVQMPSPALESAAGPAHGATAPLTFSSLGGTSTTKIQALEDQDLQVVKSPIVGTFYEAPSPGSPPFIKIGDTVEVGQVLCIIEAMKLMNEIESDVAGEVVKRIATSGQPVEYGQPLFAIRPR